MNGINKDSKIEIINNNNCYQTKKEVNEFLKKGKFKSIIDLVYSSSKSQYSTDHSVLIIYEKL